MSSSSLVRNVLLPVVMFGLLAVGTDRARAAVTVNLGPLQDTRIFNADWGWNQNDGHGADIGLYQSRDRSLLQFDLSGLNMPAGATLTSAALTLHVSGAYGGNPNSEAMNVYRLTQAWTEYGATWNKYDGTTAWATAGGDYASTVYASSNSPVLNNGDPVTWNVTSLVSEWVAGTYTNNGLEIINQGTTSGLHFASRENGNAAWRPVLAVTYSFLPPTGALTWNGGGGTTVPADGAGTWDTSELNTIWWNGAQAPWAEHQDAVFGAGTGSAGTVTVSGSVKPNTIWFAATGDGSTYTLTDGTIDLDGGARTIYAGVNATINSTITNGALIKHDTGTLTLGGTNDYAGGTTVAVGTLKLDSDAALGATTGSVTMNAGGSLDLNGHSITVGALGGSGGSITSAAPATLQVNSDGSTSTYGGTFNNFVALSKKGGGTLTLNGASSHSGGTTVNAGVLKIGHNQALGTSGSSVSVNDGASLDVNGSTLQDYTSPIKIAGAGADATLGALGNTGGVNMSAIRSIELTADAAIGGNGGRWDIGRLDFGSHTTHITGNGHVLTKVGGNEIAILAASTGLSGVTINAGMLNPHENDAFNDAPVTINTGGELRTWGGGTTGSHGGNGLTLASAITLDGGKLSAYEGFSDTYTGGIHIASGGGILNPNGGNLWVDSAITGDGPISKTGGSTLTLTGDNQQTGTLTVNGGRVTLASATGYATRGNVVMVNPGSFLLMGAANQFSPDSGLTFSSSGGHTESALYGHDQTVAFLASTNQYAVVQNSHSGVGAATASSTLTINQNIDTVYSGIIRNNTSNDSFTLALVKSGTGKLTLATVCDYTGGTTVNGGTLELPGYGGNGAVTGELTINSGGTVLVTGDGTGLGYNGGHRPTRLTINTGGLVTTAGTTHIWGIGSGVNLAGGTLQSNNGVSDPNGSQLEWNWADVNATGDNTSTIAGRIRMRADYGYTGITFNVGDGGAATDLLVNAAITEASGGLSITKSGDGTMSLTNYNSFSGTTRVGGGVLSVDNANALQSSTLDMNAADSGTLAFSQDSTLGGLTGSRDLDMGGRILSVGNNNQSTVYSGSMSNGSLTKIGTGILGLSGPNAYTGGTLVSNGILTYLNTAAQPASGTTTVPAGMTLGLGVGEAGYYSATDVDNLFDGVMANVDNDLYSNVGIDTSTGNFSYATSIASTRGLVKLGANTLMLTAPGAHTGNTRIAAGTLDLADANALQYSTLDMNSLDSGTLAMSQDSTLGGLTGSRNLDMGGRTLSIGNNGLNTTYSGVLNNGSLIKVGGGTLTLSGANAYAGGTTVNAGVLKIANDQALGNLGSTITIHDGGSLDVADNSLWNYTQPIVISGSGADGVGAITKSTGGGGGMTQLRSITLDADAAIGGVATARIDIGRGDWSPSSNLVTGNTHIDGQGYKLSLVGNLYFGILAGSQNVSEFIIGSGTSVAPHCDNAFGDAQVTLDGGTLTPWNVHTFANNLVVNSGSIDNQGSGQIYNGTVLVNGPLQINTIAGGNINLNGAVSGSGTITKIGGYSLFLAGDNSGFSGTLTSNESNTFFASESAGSATAAWVLNSGNLANVQAGDRVVHLGSLAGSGGTLANNIDSPNTGQVTFVIGENNADTTFSGTIVNALNNAGTTAITKAGAGMLTLAGANTYSGNTTVDDGVLNLARPGNGPTGTISGNLVINNGLVNVTTENGLYGYGGTSSTVTINAGGTLNLNIDQKGAHIGAVTLNGGALGSTSAPDPVWGGWTLDGDIVATGATTSTISADYMVLGGSRTLTVSDADGTLNVTGSFGLPGGEYNGGSLTKAGDGILILAGANCYTGGTTVLAGIAEFDKSDALAPDGDLTISGIGIVALGAMPVIEAPVAASRSALAAGHAVPEPGTLVLLAAAAMLGLVGCLRRRGISLQS